MKNMIRWISLTMACFALVVAGSILLSGCSAQSKQAACQDVVDEINEKYDTHFTLNMNGKKDITPEELRIHLEAVAQTQQRQQIISI